MWVRLDDQFSDHPKWARLSPVYRLVAQHLHINALCWCNRQLTDGLVPRGIVHRLGSDIADLSELLAHAPIMMHQVVDELLAVGVWEEDEDGDYHIHDYLDYQFAREEVERMKKARQAAGRRGGLAKAKQTASKPPSKTVAKSCPVPVPVPVPKIKIKINRRVRAGLRARELGNGTEPTPKPEPNPTPFKVYAAIAHQAIAMARQEEDTDDYGSVAEYFKRLCAAQGKPYDAALVRRALDATLTAHANGTKPS